MYRAQNKVIKWTTAWERWMNQQTFSLQLLFKTRPCKSSWQAVYLFYLRRANALTVKNCIWKYTVHSVCHLYCGIIQLLYWILIAVIMQVRDSIWILKRHVYLVIGRPFAKASFYWMIRYYCHSRACVVLEQFFVCLPGLCAIRHWIENAF